MAEQLYRKIIAKYARNGFHSESTTLYILKLFVPPSVLQTEYPNPHSTSKVRGFLAGCDKFKGVKVWF